MIYCSLCTYTIGKKYAFPSNIFTAICDNCGKSGIDQISSPLLYCGITLLNDHYKHIFKLPPNTNCSYCIGEGDLYHFYCKSDGAVLNTIEYLRDILKEKETREATSFNQP